MTLHPFTDDHDPENPTVETLAEGGTWLLDLVAAVDHLRRGHRPGFTVWDALEEALRWSTATNPDDDTASDITDPLAGTLRGFLNQADAPVATQIQAAVRRWVLTMADRYNNGHHWPHPTARRGFPPPLHNADARHDAT
jgi:hypothetical protein